VPLRQFRPGQPGKIFLLSSGLKVFVNHHGDTLREQVAKASCKPAPHRGHMMADKNKRSEAASEQDAEGAAKPAPVKSKRKLIIMIAAGVLAVGGGAGFFIFKPKPAPVVAAPQTKPPAFLDLPDTLVNLANTGSDRPQYLKVKIVLELPDAAMVQQVQPVMPRVMDSFQTYLRELRPTDLDGSAGLYRLKEELTRRVNYAIAPNRVNAVLFKEIVVQ